MTLNSAIILDTIFAFIILGYTIYSVTYVTKEFISDLKRPFIGISSIYIFLYFMFDLVNVGVLCIGSLYWKLGQINSEAMQVVFLSQMISIYMGSLFLLKKFNFTKLSLEIKLTYFFQFTLFSAIAACVIIPKMNESYIIIDFNSYLEFCWIIFSDYNDHYPYLQLFNFFIRVIPLGFLLGFWSFSISKKYNKHDFNYFTKSANLPILAFFCFQSIDVYKQFMAPRNQAEMMLVLTFSLFYKVIFNRAVLRWLKHPDMEAIETNAILRSKKNV